MDGWKNGRTAGQYGRQADGWMDKIVIHVGYYTGVSVANERCLLRV